jgi:hypothetical protein
MSAGWMVWGRLPAVRDVSHLHRVESDSEAHPVPSPVGSGKMFSWD